MSYSRFRFVLALLVVVGLLLLGSSANTWAAKPVSPPVPKAVAMAGAPPDIMVPWGEAGILVAWNNPANVRPSEIVEFHIWRDAVPTRQSENIAPAMACGPITAPPVSGPAGSFDHGVVDSILAREFDYACVTRDHRLIAAYAAAQGIIVGKSHQYWVTCVYRINSPRARRGVYHESAPVYAGRATCLSRPVLLAPGGVVPTDYVDLASVTFEWEGSGGADRYVIEVSATPAFARDQTWVDVMPTTAQAPLFAKSYTDVLKNSATGEVVPELAGVPPGGMLYWRVGARNRLDQPGPYPAGPSPQVSGSKNTRYIYTSQTQIYMFMTLPDLPEPPPPPPF